MDESTDVAAILKDIQQRLGFLERKIDTLLNKPDRPFRRFNRFDKGFRDQNPREGNFSDSEPRHFAPKKKFYEQIPGKFRKRSHHKH